MPSRSSARSSTRSSIRAILIAAIACEFTGGCSWFGGSSNDPRPLGADQFYRQSDNGGSLPPGPRPTPTRDPDANPAAAAVAPTNAPLDPAAAQPRANGINANAGNAPTATATNEDIKFVAGQVKPPQPAQPPAATAPREAAPSNSPPAATFAPGQFLPIGGVIAEVNGAPIYADQVLRTVAPVLAARAKDLDEVRFRNLASTEIQRQVEESIRAEVEYAAADRNTTADEKKTADRLTQEWRDKLVTESKGSIESVRRAFRDQGTSYDEAAKDQYRLNLVRVYYAKKLFPRIQVTADDLRRFYESNKDTLFTDHDQMTFRLIKITADAMGSDAAAQAKIDGLSLRAGRGEDFAQMAGETNNDPMYLKNKGLVGPIDHGAFKIDAVDDALWKLNVGQVTPVIKADDGYYLAKLESKKQGRTAAFEEDAVQRKMNETLRGRQFNKLRSDLEATLRRDSVVGRNDQMVATTIDMAMQNFPKWHQ